MVYKIYIVSLIIKNYVWYKVLFCFRLFGKEYFIFDLYFLDRFWWSGYYCIIEFIQFLFQKYLIFGFIDEIDRVIVIYSFVEWMEKVV